jgi:hypothetical protein
MTTDRERLVALLDALDASETALRRDPPIRGQEDVGDCAIWGRDDRDDSDIPIGMSCHVYVRVARDHLDVSIRVVVPKRE